MPKHPLGEPQPGLTLGIEHETGSISVGKLADIAVMDDSAPRG